MATKDTCCSLAPYFTAAPENMEAIRALCDQFVAKTSEEPKCLYYGFTFSDSHIHCREGYEDADGVLAHLENVGGLLDELLKLVAVARIEVHGPAAELDKLREPLAAFSPEFFALECGIRS